MMAVCRVCGLEGHKDLFQKDASRVSGVKNTCKICVNDKLLKIKYAKDWLQYLEENKNGFHVKECKEHGILDSKDIWIYSHRKDGRLYYGLKCLLCTNKKSMIRRMKPKIIPAIKKCCFCSIEKTLDLFVIEKRSNDGRASRCKRCHVNYQKKYYEGNKIENCKDKIYLEAANKICNRCEKDKKINEFSKSHRNATGYRNTCNQCYAELNKISREKRYNQRVASLKEVTCKACKQTKQLSNFSRHQLSALNPSCKDCKCYFDAMANKKSISNLYKLSTAEYKQMVKEQHNLCFICGKPEQYKLRGKVKRLSVDHCHKSQSQGISKVRSLLCGACNVGLGSFRDSSENLRKAADYLDFHNEKT